MFKDLVKKNRSYRGFDESYTFTEEELKAFVDLTRYTASSMNMQPLKYKIVYEKEAVENVLALTKWAAALPQLHLPYDHQHPTGFIIICQDLSISPSKTAFLKDVGIVAQTILLAASEKDLGGCMIGNFQRDALQKLCQLPEDIEPLLVVALGKPQENIVLTHVEKGQIKYYRDEEGTHYVPKRDLDDILL